MSLDINITSSLELAARERLTWTIATLLPS